MCPCRLSPTTCSNMLGFIRIQLVAFALFVYTKIIILQVWFISMASTIVVMALSSSFYSNMCQLDLLTFSNESIHSFIGYKIWFNMDCSKTRSIFYQWFRCWFGTRLSYDLFFSYCDLFTSHVDRGSSTNSLTRFVELRFHLCTMPLDPVYLTFTCLGIVLVTHFLCRPFFYI